MFDQERERAKCGSIAYTWKITDNDENPNHIENEIKNKPHTTNERDRSQRTTKRDGEKE